MRVLVACLLLLSCAAPKPLLVGWEKKEAPKVIENPWKPVVFITDTNKTLHVIFTNVIFTNELGMRDTEKCRALFETSTEYKLVAPWLSSGKILQKSNITGLQTVVQPGI